ncbi:MAG: Ig-like domain-containing protein [Gemmatimonadota bacterium]|nr:Ig-like domain-containing protein [Gemmatimonadota bacterium]
MRDLQSIIAVVATVGLVAACQSGATAPSDPTEVSLALTVAPSLATMEGGKVLRLSATVRHTDGSRSAPADVRWNSGDETVATVSNGVVQALKAGQVQIVATWHESRGSSVVTVLDPTEKKLPRPCIEPMVADAGAGVPRGAPCS